MDGIYHEGLVYLTKEEMKDLTRKRQDRLMHEATFKKFREIWLVDDDSIEQWFPKGERSIRIRFKNNEDFIFTYYNKEHWKITFETHEVGFDSELIDPKQLYIISKPCIKKDGIGEK